MPNIRGAVPNAMANTTPNNMPNVLNAMNPNNMNMNMSRLFWHFQQIQSKN